MGLGAKSPIQAVVCLLLVALVVPAGAAEPLTARVFRVFDGESFIARQRNQTLRVRIHGIDAPEPGQPHGEESRAILEKMVLGRHVTVEPAGEVEAGYLPARVRWGEYDIGLELVRAGAARARPGGGSTADVLEVAEQAAREQSRGLWAEDAAAAPRH